MSGRDARTAARAVFAGKHVREAIRRLSVPQTELRRQRERELAQAKMELDNVFRTIRAGLVTSSTKTRLEGCERRVAELETSLSIPDVTPSLNVLPDRIESYLSDLRGVLNTGTAATRRLLSSLLEPIPLRPVNEQLVGELRGNLAFLLGTDGEMMSNYGAGRRILRLSPRLRAIRIIP